MKLSLLTDKEKAEIKRIQDSIPAPYFKKLMVKVQHGKEVLDVLKKAVDDPTNTDEQRRKAQLIIDSGMLEKETEEADPEIEKRIDDFVQKQIERSVKLKRLPSKEEMRRRENNQKKNERKN